MRVVLTCFSKFIRKERAKLKTADLGDSPTERQKTGRRMTERRKTGRRMTERRIGPKAE